MKESKDGAGRPAVTEPEDVVALIMRRVSGELVSVADISEACDVANSTVRGWIEDKKLRAVDLGSDKVALYRVGRAELERFLRARLT